MGSAGTVGEATVTPIYWAPSGYTFPPSYQSIINTYITNVAADSGKPTNVYAATTQYANGTNHINYKIHAGTPLADTTSFPTSGGCTPDAGAIYQDSSGYRACITDAQLKTEVTSFLTIHSLPSDLAHLYVVFLPQGAESCFSTKNGLMGGDCSVNPASHLTGLSFCGYHSFSGIYASLPFSIHNSPTNFTCSAEVFGGPGNQSPNGNLDADAEISILSHEVIESVTDPQGTAWFDSSGFGGEIGDDCNFIYGSPSGGSNGTFFNQTINGGHYFTQEGFSNEDFNTNRTFSCIQQEEPPTASFVVTTATPLVNSPVAFQSAASNDPDKSAGIASFSWDFGDGSPSGSGATSNHTYTSPGTYSVALTVTDVDGWRGTISHPLLVVTGNPYTAVPPTRICDTRPVQPGVAANQCNTGGGAGALGPAGSRTVSVAGAFSVPPQATAAVLNVTITDTTAPSFLSLWPAGQSRPNASNLNWTAGTTIPNLVQVALGGGGQVSVFNAFGSADVIIDLEGYVASASTGLYNSLSPSRICDTRAVQPGVAANQCNNNGAGAGTLGAAGSQVVTIEGHGGVPVSGVTAVTLNVTVTGTTAPSFLAVWPDGTPRPNASNLNWPAGQTIPNRVIVPVSVSGQIDIFNAFGNADVIADVSGYFTTGSGAKYTPIAPARICDSRALQPGVAANQCNNNGLAAGTLGPAGSNLVQVTGPAVPNTATAAVLNITVTGTTAPSFLTAWPDGAVRPNASDLNWSAGATIPNLVVVKVGPGGKIDLFNAFGSADVIVDVEGYYS